MAENFKLNDKVLISMTGTILGMSLDRESKRVQYHIVFIMDDESHGFAEMTEGALIPTNVRLEK